MKVLVLLGGRSTEREISLRTGTGIVRSLARLGHDVRALDTGTGEPLLLAGGTDVSAAANAAASAGAGTGMAAGGAAGGGPLAAAPGATRAIATLGQMARDVDVVFIALHGAEGEDGTIQALLELAGVPYTGSGILGSAVAMNKEMSRRLFKAAGIPVARGFFIADHDGATPPRGLREFAASVGWPLVVKPNDQGSTVGLTIATDAKTLDEGIALAARFSRDILIEEYIPGRELTVGIIGDEALPVVEIVPESGLYDYEAKYTKGKSRYDVPANLPEPQAMRVRELGRAAFHALGCRGFARVDFRLHPDGTPYCLEVNTIPGMTELSLLPMAARAVGIDYDALVEQLVQLALGKPAPVPRS